MSITAIARRYGEAIADAAIDRNQVDAVDEELHGFAELIKSSAELRETLASPIVSPAIKQRILDAIIDLAKPSQLTANLLRLLLRHYRLHHLDVVYQQFRRVINDRKGIAIAEVVTAAPIGVAEQQRLHTKLEHIAGKKVQLQFKTDANLIGGVVTRIGSVVYDGSIRTQLQEIKQRLKAGDGR